MSKAGWAINLAWGLLCEGHF